VNWSVLFNPDGVSLVAGNVEGESRAAMAEQAVAAEVERPE
jgi:hypothetical protein